ncbi:MAG: hypothetical protein EZS28_053344, partial [Streblomastix strix]
QNSGPLTHACFHLLDSSTIYACGAGFFRVFKLQDQSVKSIPGAFGNKNLKNYTHMCWLTTSKMLVGAEEGLIYLIESNELRGVVAHVEGNATPRLIVPTMKGFCVITDGGTISAFESSTRLSGGPGSGSTGPVTAHTEYVQTRAATVDGCEIVTASLLQSNTCLLCIGTTKGQILRVDVSGNVQLPGSSSQQSGSGVTGADSSNIDSSNQNSSQSGVTGSEIPGLKQLGSVTSPAYTSTGTVISASGVVTEAGSNQQTGS